MDGGNSPPPQLLSGRQLRRWICQIQVQKKRCWNPEPPGISWYAVDTLRIGGSNDQLSTCAGFQLSMEVQFCVPMMIELIFDMLIVSSIPHRAGAFTGFKKDMHRKSVPSSESLDHWPRSCVQLSIPAVECSRFPEVKIPFHSSQKVGYDRYRGNINLESWAVSSIFIKFYDGVPVAQPVRSYHIWEDRIIPWHCF